MSKKLTRKGLALGTALAFGATVLAGSPALAATQLKVSSSQGGENYTALVNSYFEVKASGSLVSTSSETDIDWKITNTSGADIDVNGDYDSSPYLDEYEETDGDWNDTSYYLDGYNGGDDVTQYLSVSAYNISEATTVTVTAFFDDNDNGILDSDETSASQPIKYVPVKATITLDQPFIGDDKVVAHVTYAGVNMTQLWNEWTYEEFPYVDFTADGDTTSAGYDSEYAGSVEFVSSTKTLDYSYSYAVGGDEKHSAQVWSYDYDSAAEDYSWVKSGARSSKSVAEAKTDYVDDYTTEISANVAEAANSYDYIVRPGTATVTFSLTGYDIDDNTVAAGRAARVTVDSADLNSKSSISFLGKKFASTDDSVAAFTTTDSSGSVIVPLTVVGKDGDYFDVTISIEGQEETFSYLVDAAEATTFTTLDNVGGELAVKAGSTYKINYTLLDQYAQPFGNSTNYRVVVDADGEASDKAYNFSAGKATATINDENTDDEDYTVTAYVEKKTTAEKWSEAISIDVTNDSSSLHVTPLDNITVDSIEISSVDSDKTATLTYFGFKNVDERLGQTFDFSKTNDYGTIDGTVSDEDGNSIPGALVTISADGQWFEAKAYDYGEDYNDYFYSTDSITLRADSNGEFNVDTYSHKAGAVKYTITSGSVTETFTVTYDSPNEEDLDDADLGTKLSLTSPAAVYLPGRVASLIATVTDKWGNGFDLADSTDEISFDSEGVGYLTESAVAPNSKGQARVKLITDATEAGPATITATFDDGTEDGLEATFSALFGVTASSKATANAISDVSATVKYAAGATVKVYVAGKLKATKVATSNSYTFTVKSGLVGYKLVSVYVNGVRVNTGYKTLK